MKNILKTPQWTKARGKNDNIVLTSRVRLARNLKDFPFPNAANQEKRTQMAQVFQEFMNQCDYFDGYYWHDMDKLLPIQKQIFLEEYLISPMFLAENGIGRALAFNTEKNVSLMVNEEDHIRIQVLSPGFDFKETWLIANRLDNEIEDKMDYAFSTQFGYKTACITNAGTALRVSVMLHIPAVIAAGKLDENIYRANELGFMIRGIYGEGTNIHGNLIQLSNRLTIGLSEETIIRQLERITDKIVEEEKNLRNMILNQQLKVTEDKINRSLGILKTAKILSFEEFMELFSLVRLGVDMEFLPEIPKEVLNRMFLNVRSGHLQFKFRVGEPQQADLLRAEYVKGELASF
ncbi:MAG: ATP--guanido phosphotransferase [Vulcanimicrobiota bacterium]